MILYPSHIKTITVQGKEPELYDAIFLVLLYGTKFFPDIIPYNLTPGK